MASGQKITFLINTIEKCDFLLATHVNFELFILYLQFKIQTVFKCVNSVLFYSKINSIRKSDYKLILLDYLLKINVRFCAHNIRLKCLFFCIIISYKAYPLFFLFQKIIPIKLTPLFLAYDENMGLSGTVRNAIQSHSFKVTQMERKPWGVALQFTL